MGPGVQGVGRLAAFEAQTGSSTGVGSRGPCGLERSSTGISNGVVRGCDDTGVGGGASESVTGSSEAMSRLGSSTGDVVEASDWVDCGFIIGVDVYSGGMMIGSEEVVDEL